MDYVKSFRRSTFKLGHNAQFDKIWAWTYFRCRHVFVFWKSIRSGVSYVSMTYKKANNKYLKFYDPKQESKQIIYLDTNMLYGYPMSKFPPTSRFK